MPNLVKFRPDFRDLPPEEKVSVSDLSALRSTLAATRIWVLLLAGCGMLLILITAGGIAMQACADRDQDASEDFIYAIIVALLELFCLGWPTATLFFYVRAISQFQKSPDVMRLRGIISAQRAVWMSLGVLSLIGALLWLAANFSFPFSITGIPSRACYVA